MDLHPPPNLYAILGLRGPRSGRPSTAETTSIRRAYHTALLRHHPDKQQQHQQQRQHHPPSASPINTTTTPPSSPPPSIDHIRRAYATLSHPRLRAAYDGALLCQQPGRRPAAATATTTAAATYEVVDLDALEPDEDGWHRACGRCGDERGFVVTERDLEAGAAQGWVVTGCAGCSLWLKVEFEEMRLEDGGEGEGEGQAEGGGASSFPPPGKDE
ncbi:MAG: hypothetical protein M1826_001677 [Phylliscum demangeonii]|nr:MAG: hypothetical protein M1826_001677 [Phylliscum demangeonii]